MYLVEYTPRAIKDLHGFPEKFQSQIREEIVKLSQNPINFPGSVMVKSTKEDEKPAYRDDKGWFRLVYRIFPDLRYIVLCVIEDRKTVYREHIISHAEARNFVLSKHSSDGTIPKPDQDKKVDPRRQRELDRKENNKKKHRRGSLEESLDWLNLPTKI